MFKETIILIAALLLCTLYQSPGVLADDTGGKAESSQAENQTPSDFDDWYKPDDAYPVDDQQQAAENEDKANGPDEGPFLGPSEDDRSKLR